MNTIRKQFYYLALLPMLLLGTACADDNTSLLKKIIKDSINNQSKISQRTTIRKTLKWPDSCEERFNSPKAGLTFFEQSSDKFIVQVTCTYGSYQGMSLFYKLNISNSTSSQIILPTYNTKANGSFSKSTKDEVWGNVLTTSTVGKFKVLNLYSGYGNCGTLTTYDLTGNTPKIILLKMQSDCDAKEMIRDPEKWKEIKFN